MVQTITINSIHDFESASQMLNGNNTIKGSALIRQRGGGVVTCAGNEVFLLPVERMSLEMIQKGYGNTNRGYRKLGANVVYANNQDKSPVAGRKTTCNAQGFFSFDNLGDGEFFIESTIQWGTGYVLEGGHIMQKVSVRNGQQIEVVLTP